MYKEIMMNDDNLKSNLLTSSLLKCVLLYKLNCVFTAQWQEMNLTLNVLCDLTLQVNLFSGNVIYWLPQFTRKYNGMFISILSGRCGRSKCEC